MNTSQQVQVLKQEKTDKLIFSTAVIDKPRTVKFIETAIKACGDRELIVKMEGVGLCASNIPVWEGRDWFHYPLDPGLPGHEGWGYIAKKGKLAKEFEVGQRVALLQNNCFAEFVQVSADHAVALPSFLDNIPFPGEALGCLMNIFNRADIRKDHTVAIIGLGFLGLGLVQLCKQRGAKVVALSRRDTSLQMAASDADLCVKLEDHYQVLRTLEAFTDGKGCERVIECTGKQWPLDIATEIIGEYGKLIIAGYHQDGLRSVNMQQWNWKAIDVINAHERDPEKYKSGIHSAIEATQSGLLKPMDLISHQYTFQDLAEALETLAQCPDGFVKGFIKF